MLLQIDVLERIKTHVDLELFKFVSANGQPN